MCASRRPQELIEFHLYGTTISVLRVLNRPPAIIGFPARLARILQGYLFWL